MAKTLIIAIVLGVLAGLGANSLWGAQVGTAVAVFIVLMGAVSWVLRRNQRDLEEMKRARMAEEVKKVLGDEGE